MFYANLQPGYDAVVKVAQNPPVLAQPAVGAGERTWTFLTNHAHVLLCVSSSEQSTARELALRIGITERSVQAILTDLSDEGYLLKSRVGRRNVYEVNQQGRLRHPLEAGHTVGELIAALA